MKRIINYFLLLAFSSSIALNTAAPSSAQFDWKLKEPLTPKQVAAVKKVGIMWTSIGTQFATSTSLALKYGSGRNFMEYLTSLYGAAGLTGPIFGSGPTRRPLPGGGFAVRPDTLAARNLYNRVYTPLSLAALGPSFLSSTFASTYFANAYSNDTNQRAYNMGMGVGLAINGALLASGGGTQLPNDLKHCLYGISSTAALFEAKNQFQRAQQLWDKDRKAAWMSFGFAGSFAAAAVLPFALNYLQNKSTVT